jgi:DNA-binding response OmpR family regulator
MIDVLVCSGDAVLSDLLQRNLSHRGLRVRLEHWDPCRIPSFGSLNLDEAGIVILDLDCPPPASWERAALLRAQLPDVPLILLTNDWPDRQRLLRCEPYAHVRKPFAIQELLSALRGLAPVTIH